MCHWNPIRISTFFLMIHCGLVTSSCVSTFRDACDVISLVLMFMAICGITTWTIPATRWASLVMSSIPTTPNGRPRLKRRSRRC
ncbi:hypothetical protein BKA82DRAFT_4124401 [Pisolithus tinctorius]|nr:hypothetical protein BKA82DRAFT_4124401 [Pisolithus tinctorius]